MKINYVISLGKQCHTAQFLKDNKLRNCSYPFDWLFSWHQTHNYGKNHMIIDCLENHFEIFLNKNYYKYLNSRVQPIFDTLPLAQIEGLHTTVSHEKYGKKCFYIITRNSLVDMNTMKDVWNVYICY